MRARAMRLALTAARAADGLYPPGVQPVEVIMKPQSAAPVASLPGPSRTITVEPVQVPVPAGPPARPSEPPLEPERPAAPEGEPVPSR